MFNYIQLLDEKIIFGIKNFTGNPIIDNIMISATKLGDNGFIWIITGFIFVLIPRTRKTGAILFSVLFLNFLLNDIYLKNLIARPRPFVSFPQLQLMIAAPSSFSFPSGHASSAFASAYVLSGEFRKYSYPIYIFASIVAFSRIYLGVHYISDIAAGCLMGTICGIIILYADKKITVVRR